MSKEGEIVELQNAIDERRSIRRFKNKDVENHLIESLIDCARKAPSAKNRQPWKFLIVKGKIKDEIANIMINQVNESKIDLEKKLYNANNSVTATANTIKEAPVLILVFRPKEENWLVTDLLSLGASIEHICLKAVDLGLGSLWIRDIIYTKDLIEKLVGQQQMELNSAIAIGYQDEYPKPRPRKELEEVLEWHINE